MLAESFGFEFFNSILSEPILHLIPCLLLLPFNIISLLQEGLFFLNLFFLSLVLPQSKVIQDNNPATTICAITESCVRSCRHNSGLNSLASREDIVLIQLNQSTSSKRLAINVHRRDWSV